MADLILHKISYKDLRALKYKSFNDPYGIVAFMTDHLRETLLACPNNDDDTKTSLYIVTDGDIAVGRVFLFGTKLKMDNQILTAQAGGSMYVMDSYRSMGVGADMLMSVKMSKEYDIKINALMSEMVVPMFKKMKYIFFDIPQYVFINNTKPILESRGFNGVLLSISVFFTNIPVHVIKLVNCIRKKVLLKKYKIRMETIVPKWAEDMVVNDSHKYMELHNQEWLQWNLDYNYNGFPQDKQSFIAIYDKTGVPKGFFMTKERFEENTGRYHNTIRGTIVEWASVDKKLSEVDMNLLALSTFSKDTFMIHTVTTDSSTANCLKKVGFIRHGLLEMNIFDKKKRFDDISNINLWRIRYGFGNTIIFGEDKILYN